MRTYTIIATIENAIGEIALPAVPGVPADDIETVKRELAAEYANTGDTITYRVI